MASFSDNPFDKLRSRLDVGVSSATSMAGHIDAGESSVGQESSPRFASELFSTSSGWTSSQQVTQTSPVMTRSEKVDWSVDAELASTATDEIET